MLVLTSKKGEVQDFLDPLPIKKLRGIGTKTNERLVKKGIRLVKELREYTKKKHYDSSQYKWHKYLYRVSRGIGSTTVIHNHERKSLGAQRTFFKDSNDKKEVYDKCEEIIEKIWTRCIDKNISFKTVTLKVRYQDFDTYTKQKSVKYKIRNKYEVINIINDFMKDYLKDSRKIRLLGVSFSNFV